MTKSIHVFASDFLPFAGCPRTAGGNRSQQIISALQKAGHSVTFSMPLDTSIATKYKDRILPQLTQHEIWACENYYDSEVILNRIQPDVAVYCNVNTFRGAAHFGNNIVRILDFYGPVQLEHVFLSALDSDAAMHDPQVLEATCGDMVRKLRDFDYVMTVSERQKYFWSAYCTLAGFNLTDINVLVCPAAFELPSVSRNPAPHLTVVYSGGLYPWQNPDRFLLAAAEILQEMDQATLHIFGGPHLGMPNETSVNHLLLKLQEYRCVKYHGYQPFEELMTTLSTAWCALELMEPNLERELAVTGRTLEFLASGTPVIYNRYATLSKLIEQYQAGWTLSTTDTCGLRPVFEELARGGLELVEKLSSNARRLAVSEFSAEVCMRPLVELCAGSIAKRARADSPAARRRFSRSATDSLGRILAISPFTTALRDLRIANPLLALQRQGYIDAFTLTGAPFEELKNDRNTYDAVLVQRSTPEFVFETLHGLAIPFILDCDDNLLARAAYRDCGVEPALVSGLRHCSALTAPTPRLVHGLEKYSGLRLIAKTFIVPNGLPFPDAASSKICSPPSQLLWIQGDTAALSNSREAVLRAVDDFSQRYGLPVVLIGAKVLKESELKNQIAVGEIDLSRNLQLLESAPLSIGVAPLETNADEQTLDFIAGKSDLKILLFSGYGHAGVYSAAPPYSDSSLQNGLSIIGNSYAQWTEALEYQYRQGWRETPKIAASMRAGRHIDVVARECWRPAIQACLLRNRVRGTDLNDAFQATRRIDDTPPAALGYMLAHWDVARQYLSWPGNTASQHYENWGRGEQRGAAHASEAHQRFLDKVAQEADEHLTRAGEKKARLLGEISSLQQHVEELQDELASAQATLARITSSRSWKLTGPLRKVAGLLKSED